MKKNPAQLPGSQKEKEEEKAEKEAYSRQTKQTRKNKVWCPPNIIWNDKSRQHHFEGNQMGMSGNMFEAR